ncbi:MAG: Ig-like domain-containing protein, partial [Oscillospiraceae bacterium]|nr:Ig-like domain-containing protein [Oscillospiraceae bacterium]
MKKIISLILAFTMSVSLLSGISVNAVTAEADGSVMYGFTLKNTGNGYKNGADTTDTDYVNTNPGVFKVGGFNDHGWKPLACWYTDSREPSLRMFELNTSTFRLRERYDYDGKDGIVGDEILADGIEFALALDAPEQKGYYLVSTAINRSGIGFYMSEYSNDITHTNYKADFGKKYMTEDAYIGASEAIDKNFSNGELPTDGIKNTGKVIYSDGKTPLFFGIDIPNLDNEKNPQLGVIFRAVKLTPVKANPVITLAKDELDVDESTTVSVKVGGNALVNSFASYSVPANSCISVDKLGNIKANAPGWAVLTVSAGDLKEKMLVGVKDASGEIPGEVPSLEPDPSFPYSFIHAGDKVQIIDADSSFTFSSSETSVATVDANGLVTAIKPGKTTVTATKGELVKTFEIPVVGENLLIRNGVDHGHFENGIYFSDGTDAVQGESFWEATRRKEPSDLDKNRKTYYVYDYSYEDVVLPGRNEAVNAVRLGFDEAPEGATRNSIELQTPKSVRTGTSHSGMVALENGKIYEFTGWTAAEKTTVLGDMWNAAEYYTYDGKNVSSSNIGGHTLKPWDGKSGDQDWQMFNTFPVIIEAEQGNTVLMRPIIKSISAAKIGDILVTELSIHEVIYGSMTLSAGKTEIEASETTALSAKHFSNTGNPLKQFVNAKPVDITAPVTYESDKPEVVRVLDDKGTIIGVGDGTATVTATATIGGVTVSEEIEITVSGGERPEFIGSMELAIQGENIYPASYANACLTVKNEAGEPMTLNSDELTYESSDTGVATITSNGVIRAKTAGTATITATAKKNGLTKTATATLTVLPLPQEENFPEVIGAYFTTDYTYVGGENTIIVTDLYGRKLGGGVTYAYEIADNSVISETGGTF